MKLLLRSKASAGGPEEILPGDAPAPMSESHRGGGCLALTRLALGGGVCGGFLGIFGGALFGTLYGVCVNDLSFGLDGALLGSVVLAALGAGYGLARGGGGERPDRSEGSS